MKVCPFYFDSSKAHISTGTLFVPLDIQIEDISISMNANATPSPLGADVLRTAVDKVISLYPDDPSAGSPFGTGNQTFGTSPAFKRAAAICASSTSLLFLSYCCIHGLLSVSWGYSIPGPAPILEPNSCRTVLCLHLHGSPTEFWTRWSVSYCRATLPLWKCLHYCATKSRKSESHDARLLDLLRGLTDPK